MGRSQSVRRWIRSPYIGTFLTQLILVGSGLLNTIVLSRQLGPVGRGEIVVITILPAVFVGIAGLGLYDASLYYAAQESSDPSTVFFTAVIPLLIQGSVLTGILMLIVPVIFTNQNAATVEVMQVYLLVLPVRVFSSLATALLRSQRLFLAFNMLSIATTPVLALSAVVMAATDRLSVTNYMVAQFMMEVLVSVAAAGLLVHFRVLHRFTFSIQLLRDLYRYGLKVFAGSFSKLVNVRLDQLILAPLVSPESLGLYAIASSLSSLSGVVALAFSTVAAPTIANLAEMVARRREVTRVFRRYLIVSTPLKLAFALAAPILFPLIYGEAVRPATPILLILVTASLFYDANQLLTACNQAMDRPWIPSQGELVGMVVTVVLLLLLVTPFEVGGAALASLISYGVTCAVLLTLMKLKLQFPILPLFDLRPELAIVARKARQFARPVINRQET